MYKKLLNALYIARDNFDMLQKYIDKTDFEGAGRVLYDYAVAYYEKDPEASYVDIDIIINKLERNHTKNIKQYTEILHGFTDNISVVNIKNELIDFKKSQVEEKLIQRFITKDDTKRSDTRELMELYQFYDDGNIEEDESTETNVFNDVDVADVITKYSNENLIRLYPPSLNDAIGGGVIPQTHIIIFARPEIGKSLFTINMAAEMARDGQRVLFIEMEDPTDATLLRFISNLTGMTRTDLLENPARLNRARKLLERRGYKNVIVAECSNGTSLEVERLIKEHKPDVVFINQIRQLKFKNSDSEVQRLAMAGHAMRCMAKKYNIVVVSIHQAAGTADNKAHLELRDMYQTTTALQGDVDLAIGVGYRESHMPEDRRLLSVCKNKNGWHGTVPVVVIPTLSQVRDI